MQPPRFAIYARVSDANAPEGTIASQVVALEARLAQDGVRLEPECRFVDDGYTGATLVRPALERLRDAAAAAVLDRLYVHCSDRLARHYAYQVLLIDEFRQAGVEVVFLNRAIGTSPEDDLLLQVQGMVAEYERAKQIGPYFDLLKVTGNWWTANVEHGAMRDALMRRDGAASRKALEADIEGAATALRNILVEQRQMADKPARRRRRMPD